MCTSDNLVAADVSVTGAMTLRRRWSGATQLIQGTVTRIGGHSVGVFYVIERRMKVAVWCDQDEEEGRDLTVEVGGIVEIGGRSFALVRINAAANPPYAILAPRPSPP
jgi:hypothetical protein